MENAPLNRAHQLERKADSCHKQKKFAEAIECHKKAVELFGECLKLTKHPQALESIRLQKESNERQIKSLCLKKRYFENLEKKKEQEAKARKEQDSMETLEKKIFQTIETHDSLIHFLVKQTAVSDSTDGSSEKAQDSKEGTPPVTGSKLPKDNQTVIEELNVLSGELREYVRSLLLELDDSKKEIEKLKTTIRELEDEKAAAKNENLKVNTDSSGGTSPFVFSPCSDVTLDVKELSPLPTLDPIELPDFNFLRLHDNTNNN